MLLRCHIVKSLNKQSKGNTQRLPLLSLFSGAGGLDLGFQRAGFDVALALDNDPSAVATYNHSHCFANQPSRVADLSAIDPETIISWWEDRVERLERPRGVIGGPPCQAFSVSNVNKLADDPRAKLPLSYARILSSLNHRYDLDFFVFENVAGLAHRPHAASLDAFVADFEHAGFRVSRFFLDAVRFGVPQFRNRMFIVGFNTDRFADRTFVPPEGNMNERTVMQAIGGLPEPARFAKGIHPTQFGLHPNHWCMNPRSRKFGNGALRAGEMIGRSFRALSWDSPSSTVAYGHREVHVHPECKRRLSVFEAMLLQGFPSNYELCGTLSDQIRQVSDAVPPPLAEALASAIHGFLYPAAGTLRQRRTRKPEGMTGAKP
jgi:DNA (cytosine-5)-methyltransferase 1